VVVSLIQNDFINALVLSMDGGDMQ